jgi:aryl-alcohol dehydrogenase-like predicted oxidoreductase
MEYSLFSRDAEEQGQIDACKELGMAMMAYAVLGRGMLPSARPILNYGRPRTMLKIKAYYGDR